MTKWKYDRGGMTVLTEDGQRCVADVRDWSELADATIVEKDGERIAAVPELIETLREVLDSYEAYIARTKPEDEYDEYDAMMLPRWKKAWELLEKLA